jgi:hypothetical protein
MAASSAPGARTRRHAQLTSAARAVSVLALVAVGGDHLYVYAIEHYWAIPTIGTLFLVKAIGGFVLAAALVVPLRGLAPRSRAEQLTAGLAGAGITLAGGALAALFVSESAPLFGFVERGYQTSIVIAIVSEVTAIIALLVLAAGTIRGAGASRDGTRAHRGPPRLVPVPGELSKHEPEDRLNRVTVLRRIWLSRCRRGRVPFYDGQ